MHGQCQGQCTGALAEMVQGTAGVGTGEAIGGEWPSLATAGVIARHQPLPHLEFGPAGGAESRDNVV